MLIGKMILPASPKKTVLTIGRKMEKVHVFQALQELTG